MEAEVVVGEGWAGGVPADDIVLGEYLLVLLDAGLDKVWGDCGCAGGRVSSRGQFQGVADVDGAVDLSAEEEADDADGAG